MAGATQKPKLGNVTVATVKRREQAQEISARLEAAGIKSFLHDERGAPAGKLKLRVGGINVQVDRSDVARALETLRQKSAPGAAEPRPERAPRQWLRRLRSVDSRVIAGLQILAIVILCVLLARLFFY